MKFDGVSYVTKKSACIAEKRKESEMLSDETRDKNDFHFKVVRHEVEEGTRKYLGEGRLHHTVIIKVYGLLPQFGPVADESASI